MRILSKLNGEEHAIEIKRSEGKIIAAVDEREYELEVSELESNIYLLKMNGKIFEVFVSPRDSSSDQFDVSIKGEDFSVEVIDPKRLRGSGNSDTAADGAVEIKTAMPGKVVKVSVKVGDEVAQNEGVIIVEAMKMQNEMKSPKEGIVREIKFDEGETVNAGDVLIVIE